MGIFDNVTSWFSSSDQPPATDSEAPAPSPWAPDMMLSSHYSLANLIATSQPLSQPNMPDSQQKIDNLSVLADIVEQLESQIGHVSILSGFRTKELQDALATKGEPVASGTSFHELGRAVDIAPVTMTPAEFFGRLLANQDLKSKFAEIAIKPSQSALHLAVNTPDDTRDPKVLGLNNDGVYARLTADDILNYVKPYMPDVQAATNYADNLASSGSPSKLIYVAAALGFLGLAFIGKKKRS